MEQPDQVGEGSPVHRWKPIEDLPADLTALTRATAEVAGIRRAWAGKKQELEASGALAEFNQRLARQWSIETGILEGIYTLDRGATQTLIEQGFDAALLSHGDTDIGEIRLIQILRDHERAIEGLFAFVKRDQPLTTSYIRQLHQVLCAHQDTFEVLNARGEVMHRPLNKGEWKLLPNNPSRLATNEVVHEYCPPEQTPGEMDRLVAMHVGHGSVEPEIAAAWLHHRFVQIHPFPDGNGRVARALATLVLIQRGGFPLVVLRDDKSAYIDALRAADEGDLLPFVQYASHLQVKASLRAIDLGSRAVSRPSTRDTILAEARDRLRSSASPTVLLRKVMTNLHASAIKRLTKADNDISAALRDIPGTRVKLHRSDKAGRLDGALLDAIKVTARNLGYEAEVDAKSPWAYVAIEQSGKPSDGQILGPIGTAVLLVSIHELGGTGSGIAASNAFVLVGNRTAWTAFEPVTTAPFVFTIDRASDELSAEFEEWVDAAIDTGLAIWRRSL